MIFISPDDLNEFFNQLILIFKLETSKLKNCTDFYKCTSLRETQNCVKIVLLALSIDKALVSNYQILCFYIRKATDKKVIIHLKL